MQPSLGRIVHYREGNEVFAAIITHVYANTESSKENQDPVGVGLVDLVVFDFNHEPTVKRRFIEFSPHVAVEPGKWFWPPRVV